MEQVGQPQLPQNYDTEPFHILSAQFGEGKSCQIGKLFNTIQSRHRNRRKSVMSPKVVCLVLRGARLRTDLGLVQLEGSLTKSSCLKVKMAETGKGRIAWVNCLMNNKMNIQACSQVICK